MNKKLNSENMFLYRNIIDQNKSCIKSKEHIQSISGLNNGFIMEEHKDSEKLKDLKKYAPESPAQDAKSSNTVSRRSIPILHLNEVSGRSNENKIHEINKKIESIKSSIIKKEKDVDKDSVKLTCFQKFCGAGNK